MPDLLEIIAGCKKMEKRAQRCLYDMYAPLFLGIAFRYSKSKEDAEDILQESFVKILTRIDQYSETGSFEGWMKRVLVNTAISHYRTSQKHDFHKDFDNIAETNIENYEVDSSEFTRDELLNSINKLPPGFKVIFNLYAIEGYKHREIAEMLDISVGTSKSQYSRARALLQTKLKTLKIEKTSGNKISEK
ncbi:MAG: RNA polymerase sigma factor [Bacteroidales bacterium]|nr:RNA polymerase sigma factor [Bacteroidales bacterium]MDD4216134.1 RNA polymerase sigma factor [Bacteroidales bacterium]MDY0141905.1 RNA polymerase sigma factor [Bacteroidales bacterium]